MILENEDKTIISRILTVMEMAQKPNMTTIPTLYKVDTKFGTDGLVGNYQGKKIACFAGSNEPVDWLVNILKTTNDQGIHSGFDLAFNLVLPEVQYKLLGFYTSDLVTNTQALRDLNYKDQICLNLGGFSNGSAIACLLAAYFANAGIKVNLCTWGQPKLFSSDAISHTTEIYNYYRIFHRFDFVTAIPFGLRHGNRTKDIRTGGRRLSTHSFKQYVEQTKLILGD